jgi:hypothetical protein
MGLMEGRSEAISVEFNSQTVANMLCSYTTMGTKPGQGMLMQLEGRTETISVEFTSQDIANTMWSYATMGRKPG